MKHARRRNRGSWLRQLMLPLLAAGCISLLSACNMASAPIFNQGETEHGQQIQTFLQDFAREILAAYLF